VVLSGPSAVGKDTVIQTVKSSGFQIHHVVTCTTRLPRAGEKDGGDYFFVSNEEFDRMLAANELLEHANVHGRRYGTPVHELRTAFAAGEDALLKIDVKGAQQVRRKLPQAVFVFLEPPSLDELLARLVARGTESPEELQRRTDDAHFEMSERDSYDYIICNDSHGVDRAAEALKCIITAERHRTRRQPIDV
jgi:guanylate kinase